MNYHEAWTVHDGTNQIEYLMQVNYLTVPEVSLCLRNLSDF